MIGYMIVPLEFTIEQTQVYKIIYKEAEYSTMLSQYTVEQIVNKADARLNLTEQKVRTILKWLHAKGYLQEVTKGVKGKATVCKIVKLIELNQQLSNNYSTAIQQLSNSNDEPIPTVSSDEQQLSNSYSTAMQQLSNNLINDKENEKDKKHFVDYQDVFDHYIKANLVKHRSLTPEMKKAMDTAAKSLKCDAEEMKRMIDRHKEKTILMKDNPLFKVRSLPEFFGQKKFQSVLLICSDYSDDNYTTQQQTKPTVQPNKAPIGEPIVKYR